MERIRLAQHIIECIKSGKFKMCYFTGFHTDFISPVSDDFPTVDNMDFRKVSFGYKIEHPDYNHCGSWAFYSISKDGCFWYSKKQAFVHKFDEYGSHKVKFSQEEHDALYDCWKEFVEPMIIEENNKLKYLTQSIEEDTQWWP